MAEARMHKAIISNCNKEPVNFINECLERSERQFKADRLQQAQAAKKQGHVSQVRRKTHFSLRHEGRGIVNMGQLLAMFYFIKIFIH